MDWKYKALLQLVFSAVPGGDRLNYFFQRHVTRGVPLGDSTCAGIVSMAGRRLDRMRQYSARPIGEATFYEFGVGWDLMIPLAFYSFGVNHQILGDIRPLLRIDLVNDTIKKLQSMAPMLGLPRVPETYLGPGWRDAQSLLKDRYGIDYRAPCDARKTGLATGSIDCITSTNTLEHIPPADIASILAECHRLLRNDGIMSLWIDYQDHYAYFDRGISVYNFLRYSERAWALFSPALHYQNRLRHRDYLEFLEATSFEVLEEQHVAGSADDLAIVERLPIDPRFRRYAAAELAVRLSLIVASKRRRDSRAL